MSWWRHLRAWILLPFNVLVIIPYLLVYRDGVAWFWNTKGWIFAVFIAFSALLFLAGAIILAGAIRLLANVGRGTLAPWDPTQKLVITGMYRHVRNPMMSGVFCVLAAEAFALGRWSLVIWFAIFLAGNGIFIPFFEERRLGRRFGKPYATFCRHVPRWIPRWTPWQPPSESDASPNQKDLAPRPGPENVHLDA